MVGYYSRQGGGGAMGLAGKDLFGKLSLRCIMDIGKSWVSLSEAETRVEEQSGGNTRRDVDDIGEKRDTEC